MVAIATKTLLISGVFGAAIAYEQLGLERQFFPNCQARHRAYTINQKHWLFCLY